MSLPTKCVKIAIDRRSIPAVREWAKILNDRGNEVLATLRDEGVVVETVFLEQSAAGELLICFIKAVDLERAYQVAASSTHAIDAHHKQFQREHWGARTRPELLIDFDRIPLPEADDGDA
jgi:hypothetical protein